MPGVDLDGHGKIFLVGHLDHARHPDEINLRREIESPDNGRTGDNEDINAASSELGGNGQSPTDVT